MIRLKLTKDNQIKVINKVIQVFKAGGLVIYPTETCYGVGVDATNKKAVAKLLQYKQKRGNKPISVAVADSKMAAKYVKLNKVAKDIYKNFLPGPITVISEGKHKVENLIESNLGTLGIRIPDYDLVLKLLQKFQKPITATSANASYQKIPYQVKDILDNISNKQKQLIDLIIDAGKLPKRAPSTIIDTTSDELQTLRKGDLDLAAGLQVKVESLAQTKKFVKNLFKELEKDFGKKLVVFLLTGDLGAGKTYFTKFLGEQLQVKEVVVSPTFIICRQYQAKHKQKRINLYHIDTYRLTKAAELEDLRIKQILQNPNVLVVEWANKVEKYLQKIMPQNAVVVTVKIKIINDQQRILNYKICR